MQINCKTAGCPGTVEYIPQVVQLLTLFKTALQANQVKLSATLKEEDFSGAVKSIIDNGNNKFNSTKTAYLTCDFLGTGGPTQMLTKYQQNN